MKAKNIYKEIFELAVDGVLIGSSKGEILEVNKSLQEMLQLSEEELIGKHISTLFPAEILQKKPLRFDLLSKGKIVVSERELLRKDGKTVYIEMHSKQMPDGGFHSFIRDITKRKSVEQTLKKNEEFIRLVMDNLPIGLAVNSVNPKVSFNYINENFLKFYRISDKSKLSKPDAFWETVYEDADFRETIKKRVTEDCESGDLERMYWVDIPITRKGKETTYISARNIPLLDKGLMISTVWDVTKRKKTEDSLRYFKKAVESSSDAIGMSTPDGKHYYQNKAFSELFGLSIEEVAEPHVKSTIYADEKTGEEVFNTIMSGKEWFGEVKMINKNKKVIDVDLRAYPLKDEDGKVVSLVGVHNDITERKNIEKELDNQNRLLTTLLESLPVGVFMVDSSTGKTVIINETAKQILNREMPPDIKTNDLAEFFKAYKTSTDEIYPYEELPIIRGLHGESSHINDMYVIQPSGNKVLLEVYGRPVFDRNGKIMASIITFIDITEQQNLLESAQRADKLESLGVLAGGIAHDFNNLLGGIYGFLNLSKISKNKADIENYIDATLNTINRAKGLTQQLLTFAKGGEPIREKVDLKTHIREIADFSLSGSNIACNYDISDDLWPCTVDKAQISQVLENIIINANQAMPGGGEIDIRAYNLTIEENEHPSLEKGDYVKISIKDRGKGIPKENLKRVFDPFFTTKARGQGLGLSTSYSIMNRHKGTIDVESTPGKGTVFHLLIPAEFRTFSFEPEENDEYHEGNGTILLMDDKRIIIDTVGSMLKSFGYRVITEDCGEDAVLTFKNDFENKREIKALIFDLTIPGKMGGKEALDEIRKISPEIPVFVTSGYADDPIMANPSEYGFNDSISKPLTINSLARMLNKHFK